MKDFRIESPPEYAESFTRLDTGVYRSNVNENDYRLALSFTTEAGEGQYPFGDVLNTYLVHVEDFFTTTTPRESDAPGTRHVHGFGGDLDDLERMTELVGKRVYNVRGVEEDGAEYETLVIE